MKSLGPLLVLSALLLCSVSGRTADLSRIERTIKKEPPYKTTARYGLLVFGPEAKTKVWLALDGTDLYVDMEGDGDLTAGDKRFPSDGKDFQPFEIADRAGKDCYRVTSLSIFRNEQDKRISVMVHVEIVGKYKQYCDLALATRLTDAPIAHFHGPLKLGLQERKGICTQMLVLGEKPSQLYAWIGTFDRANGCWVVVSNLAVGRSQINDFPPNIHPVAEVEFQVEGPDKRSIRQRYELKERC